MFTAEIVFTECFSAVELTNKGSVLAMRIVSIEPIPIAIPYHHEGPVTGFGGSDWPTLRYLLVRVGTEDGLGGWGGAFGYSVIPATAAGNRENLATLAIDSDTCNIVGI